MLEPGDLAAAAELSALAGWNQTAEDWGMLLELDPDGCFGIEAAGRIVATTTLLCYGRRIAWIGMVLTHPALRRQGLARRLVTRALERTRMLGIETVKLDASNEGRALYESMGFRAEQPIERWILRHSMVATNEAARNESRHPPNGLFEELVDAEACGYDRMKLLRSLSERSEMLAARGAYLFCRPGRLCRYIGPCIAQGKGAALCLITRCIQNFSAAGLFWDLLPENQHALELAQELGFTRQRVLTRMVLGQDLQGREEWIYAAAGFELG